MRENSCLGVLLNKLGLILAQLILDDNLILLSHPATNKPDGNLGMVYAMENVRYNPIVIPVKTGIHWSGQMDARLRWHDINL